MTDEGLLEVIRANPQLEDLNLYADAGLSDVSLASLGTLTELRHLDLCGMQFLTDDALSCLAACTQLRTLNLTWCVLVARFPPQTPAV